MNTVKLKEANIYAIRDFSLYNNTKRIQGTKLQALYRLIQKKGEKVRVSGDHELKGHKALQFNTGEYICIIHTPCKKGFFFPCSLRTAHLQELTK
jgi:hypothetical protein